MKAKGFLLVVLLMLPVLMGLSYEDQMRPLSAEELNATFGGDNPANALEDGECCAAGMGVYPCPVDLGCQGCYTMDATDPNYLNNLTNTCKSCWMIGNPPTLYCFTWHDNHSAAMDILFCNYHGTDPDVRCWGFGTEYCYKNYSCAREIQASHKCYVTGGGGGGTATPYEGSDTDNPDACYQVVETKWRCVRCVRDENEGPVGTGIPTGLCPVLE